MPKPSEGFVRIFEGCSGLNNTNPSDRFKPDQAGLIDAAIAYNVDILDLGSVELRSGYSTTARTEAFHSLFYKNNYFLGMAYVTAYDKDALYKLGVDDYSKTGLRSDMTPGQRMSYCFVNDRVYYCNGYENGYVLGDVSYAWTIGEHITAETTKTFSSPPVGHLVEHYNGRMFIAEGSNVWYSEKFDYSAFNLATSYLPFGSRIKIMKAVYGKDVYGTNGLYIGDGSGVYYVGGDDPEEFFISKISSSVPIEGTDITVDGSMIGSGQPGIVTMWGAQDGIWLGQHSCKAINLTLSKLTYPGGLKGSATFFNGKYIMSVEE